MKFKTESGKLAVSLTHVPGRGSGTFEFKTGSHAEFDDACSLNFPAKKRTQKNHKISTSERIKSFSRFPFPLWHSQVNFLPFLFFFFSILIEKTVNILSKDFHVRWELKTICSKWKNFFFLYLNNYFPFSCLVMTNFHSGTEQKTEKTLDSVGGSIFVVFFLGFCFVDDEENYTERSEKGKSAINT